MEKYIVITTPDRDFRKSNRWFDQCERENKPFVKICKKSKYYELHWDYISLCTKGRRFEMSDGGMRQCRAFMDKYWPLKARYWCYGPVCSIPKLTLEQAQLAAVEIYDILAAQPVIQYTLNTTIEKSSEKPVDLP